MGICMDINPHRFEAPWTAYEFANHVLASETPLVLLSTAWLTHIPVHELAAAAKEPDNATVVYWMERFAPLKLAAEERGVETTVVIANRVGTEEGGANYAGSSCVMRFRPGGGVEIYDVLGRAEERILVVDLGKRPKFTLMRREE
jgi:protein N-terminal amidase